MTRPLAGAAKPATLALTAALTVGLAVAASSGAALAASPAAASTGTLSVQLRSLDGDPLDQAGVTVRISSSAVSGFVGTSNAAGSLTFAGIPVASYAVTVTSVPQVGDRTLALVTGAPQTVTAGHTTTDDLDVPVGATASGALVKADGSPLVGAVVRTYETLTTLHTFSATTDSAGRYTLVGLGNGLHTFTASASTSSAPAEWKAQLAAQTPTASAERARLPTHLVHSDYDLRAGIETERDPAALAGALVRATNTATGVSYDETTSRVVDTNQLAEYDIPSGSYTIRIVTVGTAAVPSQTWWFTKTNNLSLHRAAAATFALHYGTESGAFGTIDPL